MPVSSPTPATRCPSAHTSSAEQQIEFESLFDLAATPQPSLDISGCLLKPPEDFLSDLFRTSQGNVDTTPLLDAAGSQTLIRAVTVKRALDHSRFFTTPNSKRPSHRDSSMLWTRYRHLPARWVPTTRCLGAVPISTMMACRRRCNMPSRPLPCMRLGMKPMSE